MKIDLHEVPVRDVAAGYVDSAENGVVGYGGRLNMRPAFQREFIYKDKQRDEVIRTIAKQFPLNVMYGRKVFARSVASTLILRKCKPTTLPHGARAAKLSRKTAKCFVRIATAARATYKLHTNPNLKQL